MARVTSEQRRAEAAYQLVAAVNADLRADLRAEYGRQAVRLPALIHHCGLCQALVFLEAKTKGDSNSPHGRLLDHVAKVCDPEGSAERLTQTARSADLRTYVRMSREASASAEWLKRYAEALGFTKSA